MRRPYPLYRDSGVEWLGDVPEHWEVKRLKHVAAYRTSSVDKKTEDAELPVRLCNYTDVYYQDRIRASDGDYMQATASPKEIARFKLNRGDVLITKDSEDWRDIAVPALIDETAGDFVCGYHLGLIRTTKLADPEFIFRLMQSQTINQQLQTSATGVTRYGLPNAAVGETLIPLPPCEEQRGIAAFLDRETGKIDLLVDKKRSLIERLEEYRQALITRTVTKGLPPDAARAAGLDASPRLKHSGVEWLGDIPDHWEIKRLGRFGSFFKGGGGTKEDETDGGVPCVRYGDLYTQHEYLIRHTRARIAEDTTDNYRELEHGDVLFAGSGETIEEIGKSAVNLIEGRAYCGGDVVVFRPTVEVDATYMGYTADCQPSVYQKACMGRGVTVMHIYSRELKQMLIPLPPVEEQRAIGSFLDERLERLDGLVSSVEAAIERLAEYRAALITAAVTGKIDVRGDVPAEPERVGA